MYHQNLIWSISHCSISGTKLQKITDILSVVTTNLEKKFLQLLRCVLETEQVFPGIKPQEWPAIYEMAQQQSLTGILFEAIEKKDRDEIGIPLELLLEWTVAVEQINGVNKRLNQTSTEVATLYEKQGFQTCILKGQGNALVYPKPGNRMPGDVDIWVNGLTKSTDIRDIIRLVRETKPKAKACYHHIDAGLYNDVEVEVHYRPSFMFNPIHNGRLQRWYKEKSKDQFCNRKELPDDTGTIAIPTTEFNIIFQLSHIYNHVLHEGIGLRQVLDYYYLLSSLTDGKDFLKPSRNERTKFDGTDILRHFGLWKFAGAVMWVLHNALGLKEKYLIAPLDEVRGRFLLQEIFNGGNFGQYDHENIKANNRVKKNVQRIRRDLRMVRYYPSECLWEPVFRVYHLFWRLVHNYNRRSQRTS